MRGIVNSNHKEQRMIITTRPLQPQDHAFVLALVPRFTAFAVPPWRSRADIDTTNQRTLAAALNDLPQDTLWRIAQDDAGTALGFVHVETHTDYFSGEAYGYIADIAIAAAGEGRGVGQVLMQAAEAWARERGYRFVALNVFAANERARQLYARLGYSEEVVKYVKPLHE